jgi:aquaporin SIP
MNIGQIFVPQAFGWAYVNNRHNTWEQFYVYWISPFIGAVLAAWIFKALFLAPPPKPKAKKA